LCKRARLPLARQTRGIARFDGVRFTVFVAVDLEKLVKLPAAISYETAAATMLQGLTAHYLTNDSHSIKPGETAVVHAAAGGVGLLLTQIIKLKGGQSFGGYFRRSETGCRARCWSGCRRFIRRRVGCTSAEIWERFVDCADFRQRARAAYSRLGFRGSAEANLKCELPDAFLSPKAKRRTNSWKAARLSEKYC